MQHSALLLALLCSAPLAAQTIHGPRVTLAGVLGEQALLVVNDKAPKGVRIGETFEGVSVVSVEIDRAVLLIGGKRETLRVGHSPLHVGNTQPGSPPANTVILTADGGGHFLTQGQINGRAVSMLIDTGATLVALSEEQAQRIGIDYQKGQKINLSTANGVIPGWRVKLATVRIGDVTLHEVDATVSTGSMPHILLGNSFLTRFQMTRTNEQLLLEKRY